MTAEQIELLAQQLTAELSLSAEDRAAIVLLAERLHQTVAALDELPLDNIEPAAVFANSAE